MSFIYLYISQIRLLSSLNPSSVTPEISIVRTYAVALAQNPMIFVGYLLIKSVEPSLLFGLQWSKEAVWITK